jgi:light-independent protochlorophyllide reductase subunit B
MERHIAKRLGIFCAVISAPVHVQDFPARYAPQMGPEGANVLFDSWIHPLVMGLEEHLLGLFQEDFEFGDGAVPSHRHNERPAKHAAAPAPSPEAPSPAEAATPAQTVVVEAATGQATWTDDAQAELKRIPFFVRGKARKNTETFAREKGITRIDVETLYEAKAHFGGR